MSHGISEYQPSIQDRYVRGPLARCLSMDNLFLTRALALSLESVQSGCGGPFGAVLVQENQIVAEGSNCVTSTNDPTAHAEITAIREGCRKLGRFHLEGTTLYSSCEPCPMCLAAIYWARIDRVVFANTRDEAAAIGFDDAWLYEQVRLPLEKRALKLERILLPEARQAFEAWAQKPDKIPY